MKRPGLSEARPIVAIVSRFVYFMTSKQRGEAFRDATSQAERVGLVPSRVAKVRGMLPDLRVASAEGPNTPFRRQDGHILTEAEARHEVDTLTSRSLARLAKTLK